MEKTHLAPIEQYVVDKVRKMRKQRGISQKALADLLDISHGFIGKIESPAYPSKWNIELLNEVAIILDCSIKDFFPDKPLK